MGKAGRTLPDGAPAKSGCGCSANPAATPGETAAAGCCGGDYNHADHAHHEQAHRAAAKTDVRDPVCGMGVAPAPSLHRFDYSGKTYHFCSAACRSKFAADPQAYLS